MPDDVTAFHLGICEMLTADDVMVLDYLPAPEAMKVWELETLTALASLDLSTTSTGI